MSISAYLHFDGNCAEAFDFYRSIFGGEFVARQTFGDGPPEMNVASDEAHKIMHVSLPIGTSILMGSDVVKGFGDPPKHSNSFSLSYAPTSREEADRIHKALQAGGGTEAMPMQETFWGSYFGMCKDRFGVHWMININLQN